MDQGIEPIPENKNESVSKRDWARWLGVAVAVVGAVFIVRYVVIAAMRIGYPYQLEWCEGGVLDHVRRVLEGKPLYAEPSMEFIAFLYPPAFYWTGAAACWVMGLTFVPLRLISVVTTLLTMAMMADIVRRETGRLWAGVIAAGLYAAMYDTMNWWLDLARVDSFYMVFILGSIYLLHYYSARGAAWAVAAGVVGAVAALTKQSTVLILGPVIIYELIVQPRRAWPMPATLVAVAGGVAAWLIWSTDGWFVYYMYTVPSTCWVEREMIAKFWRDDLFKPLAIAMAITVLALCLLPWRSDRRTSIFFTLLCVVLVGSAYMMRLHVGGAINCTIPAYVTIALMGGMAAGLAARGPKSRRFTPWLMIALLAQFCWLRTPESGAVPSADDLAAGKHYESILAGYKGEVLTTSDGFILARLGKKSYAHTAAWFDVMHGPARWRRLFLAQMHDALRTHRFDAIIIDRYPETYGYTEAINGYYRPDRPIFDRHDVFRPKSGFDNRPEGIFLPK